MTLTFFGPPPAGMTEQQVLTAARAAAAAWSQPAVSCTGLSIVIARDPAPGAAVAANDHANRLIFRADVWAKNGKDDVLHRYDSRSLAVTNLSVKKPVGGGREGEIVDADIELNAVNFNWSAIDQGASEGRGRLPNLQTTITHEIGHLLGLGHTCDDGSALRPMESDGTRAPRCIGGDTSRIERAKSTLMYPEPLRGDGEIRDRLSPDEVRVACEIYPVGCGGCRVQEARAGVAAIAAVAFFAAFSAVRFRNRCRWRLIKKETIR